MNKKIISGVIAASIIVGSIPIAALADIQSNNSDSTAAVQSSVNSASTTGASVTVNTTNEKDSSSTESSNSENTTTQITTVKNSRSNQNEENAVTTTTGSAITVDDAEPVKIETEIKGTATVGQTVSDKVIGYNAEGKKIALDENDLSYKWFTGGKQIGTAKDLTITEDMDGEKIDCQVSYDDGKEGNK